VPALLLRLDSMLCQKPHSIVFEVAALLTRICDVGRVRNGLVLGVYRAATFQSGMS
jgi:hypothetical protein